MPVSFVFTYAHPITQRYRQHKKYCLLPLYGNTEDSLMTAHTPMIDE